MAWFDEAFFYHIYPLGLLGAPERNDYGEPVPRLRALEGWLPHLEDMGVTALYLGPVFQSGSHGYDTADYRTVDSRLGRNEDLRALVDACHARGIRVVLDAVFNHTGRDFFAFRDLRQRREQSPYRDWYRGVNFFGDTEYHDGFSYENWGGYNLLAKLNLQNPAVSGYLLDTVRFWVEAFDIDGLRLDAADVLDFGFLRQLRGLAKTLKPEFWLMGEVIHGEYGRWVNGEMLHSVTDYPLYKALYSGHNDHNYFEIAHTVDRFARSGVDCRALYSFADNHDVERIMSRLRDRRQWESVHILLFALPGIPSVYYGSEFGVEGRKERGSDASLRPALALEELLRGENPCLERIRALGRLYRREKALALGEYRQLWLTTRQYAFLRGDVLVAVNNDENEAELALPWGEGRFHGALHGGEAAAEGGCLRLRLPAGGGEIYLPETRGEAAYAPLRQSLAAPEPEVPAPAMAAEAVPVPGLPYEEMTVPQLQAAVLQKLSQNGPVTERMRREVAENVYRDSLLNWVRSFR